MFIIKSLFGGEIKKGDLKYLHEKGGVKNQKMMEELAKNYVDTLNRKQIESGKPPMEQTQETKEEMTRQLLKTLTSNSDVFDLQKETDGEEDFQFYYSESDSIKSIPPISNILAPKSNNYNHSTTVENPVIPNPKQPIDSKYMLLETEMKRLHDQIVLERDQRSVLQAKEEEEKKQRAMEKRTKKQEKLQKKELKKQQKQYKKQEKTQRRLSLSSSSIPFDVTSSFSGYSSPSPSPAPSTPTPSHRFSSSCTYASTPPPLPPRNPNSPATPRPLAVRNHNTNSSSTTTLPPQSPLSHCMASPVPSPIAQNRAPSLLKEIQVGVKLTPTKTKSPPKKGGSRVRSASTPVPMSPAAKGLKKSNKENNKENVVFGREDIADFLQRALASKFENIGVEEEEEAEEQEEESPNTSMAWT